MMPIVNIQYIDSITDHQKRQVIEQVTEIMVKVLNKKPESTYIVLQKIETENWGVNGQTVSDRRNNN
ncbi:4-oxalocrotonate tautomerase family protein [Photobacterium sp. WH24]|nr:MULTISPECIES: 4-oxalocrotonate tautomerase family protein [Photobacterium]MBV7263361.1 4-oxalocrotonate tautomerase family protein [Photobacterium sp. WH24]